jgi:hypothetical protein
LQTTAIAGATATVSNISFRSLAAVSPNALPTPTWVDKPMRWAQLTLVEDDPGKFDPQFWLDYFKRTRSDAVTLSAGGCVAYYPTQVPFHHRSQWLGASSGRRVRLKAAVSPFGVAQSCSLPYRGFARMIDALVCECHIRSA